MSLPHSLVLSHLDPVARQSQDGWRCDRMQELQEGDEYAIQPPSGPHSLLVVTFMSVEPH